MLKRITMLIIIMAALLPVQANATVSPDWEKHVIAPQYRPIYLYVKDLDRDGDLDVVSTTNQHPALFYSEVAWFRNNLNQNAPWEKFVIDSSTGIDPITNANGVVVADLDGDGYEDVAVATGRVTKSEGGVYWYKAPADPTGAWQRFDIEEGTIDSYFKIDTMDANSDGLKDLVVGGRQGAVIFLNPGNPALPGTVWQKVALPQGTGSSVYLDDLNGDGRLDIVNTLLHGNVSWIDVLYQDGQFVFNRTMIDSNLDNAFDVNCLDVNGDSKKDVLVSNFALPNIYWYENPTSPGDPWIQHIVTNTYLGTDIYTGDINKDGRGDFVASGLNDMRIAWFEYTWENGQALWTEHLIDDNINQPGDNSLNDLDGDGDLDVVVCGLMDDQMIWYENKLTPPQTFLISGTVTSSGSGLSGVSMALTGTSTDITTTDASGNYSFSGLSNGSYTVTPSKTGYTFTPTSIPVTISGANQTGKNFTATATGCSVWADVIAKYTIYVSGQAVWADVINCYTQYVAAHP
jgi:hypothetical protein